MLDNLLSDYTNAVHDWVAAVADHASYSHWQEYLRTQVGQQTDLQLWNGPDQDFGYLPPGMTTPPGANLAPPANVRGTIPPTFLVADWLGLGKVSVTYVPYYIEKRLPPRGGEPSDIDTLWLDATVAYTNVPIWRRSVKGPTYGDANAPSEEDALSANWTAGSNMKAHFEAGDEFTQTGLKPAEQPTADALTAATRATVAARINMVRTEYFAWITAQSSSPTTSTPAPLFYTQASAIDGARALLDLLIALAFEQPRYGDDLLRALFDGAPQPNGLRLPASSDLLTTVAGLDPSSVANTGPDFKQMTDTLTAAPLQLLRARLQQWQDAAVQNLWKPTLVAAERNLLRLGVAETIVTAEAIAQGNK